MGEIRLYIWTDASPFRADRAVTRYELAMLKGDKVIGTRSDHFAADQNQQGMILEGLIAAMTRIHDGSGMSLTLICHNAGIIGAINQSQYTKWSQNGWKTVKGEEVKHAEAWQRVEQLIHDKVADITARAPAGPDDEVMRRLGAETFDGRANVKGA